MFGIKIKFEKRESDRSSTPTEGVELLEDANSARQKEQEEIQIMAEQEKAGYIWQKISQWALYLLIFLTPLFFLPWGILPVAGNKQFMAILLVAVALISWLAKTIASGKLVWPRTPLNVAAWLLVLSWGVSAYFSVSPSKSFGFMGAEPDNFLNVLTYVLAFFLVGAVFGGRGTTQNSAQSYAEKENGSQDSSWEKFRTTHSTNSAQGSGVQELSRINSGIQNVIFVFLASLTILAVFTGLKFLNVNILPHSASSGQAWEFAKTIDFNPIGTINALGLFLSFGLVLIVALLISGLSWRGKGHLEDAELPAQHLKDAPQDAGHPLKGLLRLRQLAVFHNDKIIKIGLILLSLILGAELLLINFRGVWWALAGAMLFLVAFALTREVQDIKAGRKEIVKTQKLVLPIVILAISVILFLVSLPIGNLIAFPAEVSPSNSATYNIAKDVWKAKGGSAEIGSGPATFSYDYGLYRDKAINQTVFWGVKFSQGSSFILTCLSTVGALGFGALIIFLAAFIWQALRIFGKKKNGRLDSLLRSEFGAEDFNIPLIAAVLFSLIAWFVYPANFTLMMLGFICLGLIMASRGTTQNYTQNHAEQRHKSGRENLREISLLVSPQRTLIISLILIILMIGSVSVLYLNGQKYIASLYFSSGLKAFNKTGDPDIALDKFVKAINLDASVDQYWRAASQAFLIKTSNTLNSPAWQGAAAAALEDLRSQFQVNMSQAISFAQRATEADSKESINWTNLGYIYENILLFVNGAEKFLVDSYSTAISLEPKNPALRVDFGRAHIAVADRLAAQINQISNSKSPDKAQIETLTAQYKEELTTATKELEKAVVLKPDYSPAHFLLVQASTREGDLKKALAKSIDYFNLNQKDPGAAFQLGFLYYKDNQMDSAKASLEWAVALNESYSNARYFLGLIYDSQGNKQAAKEQFEKIAALNPDNQEVKKILENLNAGRAALETIVPPAPAPEQRTQTPVQETGGAQQPLQP